MVAAVKDAGQRLAQIAGSLTLQALCAMLVLKCASSATIDTGLANA